MVLTNAQPTLDRPDIAKRSHKQQLSFKEVRDCLFKFLMQAGIPFTGPQVLTIESQFEAKSGEIVTITKHNSYTVNCKLKGITIDGEPVYVVVLPYKFVELEARQRAKLQMLFEQYKVIMFDEKDWKGFGLDISDKKWLKPLTKRILKAWARKLFSKFNKVGEDVNSKFALSEVLESIDKKTSKTSHRSSIDQLKKENFKLKSAFRYHLFQEEFGEEVLDSHAPIVDELTNLSDDFLKELEGLVRFITEKLRNYKIYNYYGRDPSFPSELCNVEEGLIYLTSPNNPAELVNLILLDFPKYETVCITNNLIQINNKKTLQESYLYISKHARSNNTELRIGDSTLKAVNSPIMVNLHLVPNTASGDIEIYAYTMATKYCNKNGRFSHTKKLPCLLESGEDFTLWSELK
jgi:hypothetical protein